VNLWQALHQAETLFESHGIDSPRIEAELLLRHATGLGRARMYAELQESLANPQEFQDLVERRLHHEPTAYITNRRAFYGLDFYVDPRVLIPRQETELVVEEALQFARENRAYLMADVGTGSGAIAISLAVSLPQAEVYAIDISADALEVASLNCRKHDVINRVHILRGEMLDPLPVPVDIIAGNLPYVRDLEMEQLSPEIREFEPREALAGGPDGLDSVRQFLSQVSGRVRPGGVVMFEVGQGQSEMVVLLCRDLLPSAQTEVVADLAGIDRVIKVTNIQCSN
jgi:release factor glutamine methyltransferase